MKTGRVEVSSDVNASVDVHFRLLHLLILGAGVGTTLAVTPWSSFDPINIIKLMVLTTFMLPILYLSIFMLRRNGLHRGIRLWLFFWLSMTFFVLSFSLPLLFSPSGWQLQLWGAWGRSTGFIAFLSLTILMMGASHLIKSQIETMASIFLKLSYAITFYVVLQIAKLDPIPWSQKLPVATLGNINFMSALLGLACIFAAGKVMSDFETFSSRIFFAFLICLNLILIITSGSLQGLVMFLSGSTIILAGKFNYFRISLKKQIIWFFSAILFVLPIGMGVFGNGPLGKYLIQETMLFRSDYWRAGVNMFVNNFWFGVGIDGYGDFYRTYRDSIAVERTGAQRITNTAHNIFLDVASGGGIFVIISLLALYFVVSAIAWRLLRQNPDTITVSLCGAWFAFIVFSTISINQLGVSCWGWIFGGSIVAIYLHNRKLQVPPRKPRPQKTWGKRNLRKPAENANTHENLTNSKSTISLLILKLSPLFLVGLMLTFPPYRADAKFLGAINSGDVQLIAEVPKWLGAGDFLIERSLKFLLDYGYSSELVELARWSVMQNPRDWYSQNVIIISEKTSNDEKVRAIESLRSIDPRNKDLMLDLDGWEEEIRNKP